MTDFIQTLTSIAQYVLTYYQWLVGIMFTAGLSLLVYFKLLRINNFLAYSQKYQENLKSFTLLEKISYSKSKDEMVYKDSGNELSDKDAIQIPIIFNLLSEVGLLYRKGLIDKDLTYKHFGNVVYSLYTKHRDFVSHVQNYTKTDNIEFLFKAFSKRGVWGDRKWRLRSFFFGKKLK